MKKRKKLAAGAAIAVGAAIAPEVAQAAVITVNSTGDTAAVDGQCTLREAITNANANAAAEADCAAGTGLDTIDFALPLPATITLTSSLSIVDPLIIDGPGQTDLTIDANALSRIFEIEDADSGTVMAVEIDDLTLTNGDASGESIPGGGAIRTAETLTLTNVTISNSEADAGGAILVQGGIVEPALTIVASILTGNDASYGGAIFSSYADVEITGSTISLNTSSLFGGAILQSGGDFILTNSSVTGNTAPVVGGIALYGTDVTTLTNATITGNEATVGHAGGLYLYGVRGTVTIEDSLISGNEAATDSGGLKIAYGGENPIIIRDTEISGNIAGNATGGLYLYDTPPVTLERVRIINNTAGNYHGGGAFWDADVTIIESQISGNQAASIGGLYAGYGSYLYLINSTIANNTATTGSVGGLGLNNSFAAIDVSTISGNSAPTGAAGNVFSYGSSLYISNSIVANGTALAGPDLVTADSTVVINYSLIEDTTGATFTGANNITGVDPQLGPLQNNGGPTETMQPAATSPAVNAGTPEYTTPPNDQRGFPRPVGIVDMGAVEINPGTLQFAVNGYNVNEGAGVLTVTVSRTGGFDGPVGVNYTTSSGTAISGADFTATSGTLTWVDKDSAPQTFDIPITDDLIFEGTEAFNVTLDTPTGGATLGLAAIEVSITDNDSAPTISISDDTQTEGTNLVFNVTLSNPTTQPVTVDFATAGITATPGSDFTATSGTVTFNPLDTSEQITVVTTADGLDEPAETLNVVLSNPNANATILDGIGEGTITDDDLPPTISINNSGATEGGNVVFDVTLSAPSGQTVTVNFATTGGTATSGDDFTPNSGTLTFAPGDVSEPITVVTSGDGIDEPNETFNVGLTDPTNATIAGDTGVGTIIDDDGPPALSIADVTLPETNGPTNFVFTVTLAPSSGQTVTVDYTTQDVTANAGSDYTATSGTLTFVPGDTTETITVPVIGDPNVEPDETFNVILSNAPLATLSDAIGLGTITNDDVLPSITIDDVTLAEGDGGTTNFVFTVSLSPSSTQAVTVNFTTQDGTAVAGSDYTTTAGTLTFVPGDTSETLTVPVLADDAIEGDETFTVVLSGASFAAITDGSGQGTINNDDVAAVADLSVTKAIVGSGPFVVGQNATFTIVLSNAGPDSATNATVTDVLPTGTTLVSATPTSGTCNGTTTVTCNVGTLANGGSATITLTVQLNAPGTITNTATGASDAGDISPALGSAAITVSAAAVEGAAIPTLNEWMLIALASALAAAAALRVKP